MDEMSIVTVFYPESEWQGDLIVQKLQNAGIAAYLANRSSANMLGALGKVEMEILVPLEKAQDARALIDAILSEYNKPSSDEDVQSQRDG